VRDYLILGLIFAMLPVILFRPYLGVLVFLWLACMRPHDLAWGMAASYRLSFFVAVATLVGLAFSLGRERIMTLRLQTLLLILLWGWVSLSVLSAINPDLSAEIFDRFWKTILFCLLATGMARTRSRYELLQLVVAFSLGVLGLKYAFFAARHGGARFDFGPGGMMKDNNDFALAMNMALPLLVGIALVAKKRAMQIAAGAMAFGCLLTVVFTFSRGGFLTLSVVGFILLLRSKRPVLGSAVIVLGITAFFFMSSEAIQTEYVDRIVSIGAYTEDSSAMSRLESWRLSWQVFLNYPVLGVGPENLVAVFRRYAADPTDFHVAHNSYLQFLAETGAPGLLLFLTILAASLLQLQRLRRRGPPWAVTYAGMIQISLIAFLTGGMFLNRAYFDLVYYVVAMSIALQLSCEAEVEDGATETTPAPVRRSVWWRQPATSGPGH